MFVTYIKINLFLIDFTNFGRNYIIDLIKIMKIMVIKQNNTDLCNDIYKTGEVVIMCDHVALATAFPLILFLSCPRNMKTISGLGFSN